ncbi:MAG TPA: helix-turn-helix domain-containing protein, partial [Planctomycetota bacterium]|nr:helix-turn-helix domain-containing protein [Planctomycetota bacterium]
IPVDVRVVLATNKNLERAVAEGQFREDLYYRIHVVAIEMPPLRQRKGDIPTLAHHFLQRFSAEHDRKLQFTERALSTLVAAPWPGNVRQLENVIERAVVLSQGAHIDSLDLPVALQGLAATPAAAEGPAAPVLPLKEALAGPEKRIIEHALAHCGGNREKAAQLLGINRSTLFHKLRKFEIR